MSLERCGSFCCVEAIKKAHSGPSHRLARKRPLAHKDPASPSQASSFFEFVGTSDHAPMSCELRFNGERYGWEAQFLERGELLCAHGAFVTRGLAIAWAQEESGTSWNGPLRHEGGESRRAHAGMALGGSAIRLRCPCRTTSTPRLKSLVHAAKRSRTQLAQVRTRVLVRV